MLDFDRGQIKTCHVSRSINKVSGGGGKFTRRFDSDTIRSRAYRTGRSPELDKIKIDLGSDRANSEVLRIRVAMLSLTRILLSCLQREQHLGTGIGRVCTAHMTLL